MRLRQQYIYIVVAAVEAPRSIKKMEGARRSEKDMRAAAAVLSCTVVLLLRKVGSFQD
jgi:hypothetical protein